MNLTPAGNGDKPVNPARDEVVGEIKRDLKMTMYYLAPELRSTAGEVQTLGRSLGLTAIETETYAEKFLQAGLWRVKGLGFEKTEEFLDLGELSIADYMSATLGLTAELTENGPCWYESLMVVTTQALKHEFYRQIHRALRELVEKSAGTKGDTLLALNFAGLDCLRNAKGGGMNS